MAPIMDTHPVDRGQVAVTIRLRRRLRRINRQISKVQPNTGLGVGNINRKILVARLRATLLRQPTVKVVKRVLPLYTGPKAQAIRLPKEGMDHQIPQFPAHHRTNMEGQDPALLPMGIQIRPILPMLQIKVTARIQDKASSRTIHLLLHTLPHTRVSQVVTTPMVRSRALLPVNILHRRAQATQRRKTTEVKGGQAMGSIRYHPSKVVMGPPGLRLRLLGELEKGG